MTWLVARAGRNRKSVEMNVYDWEGKLIGTKEIGARNNKIKFHKSLSTVDLLNMKMDQVPKKERRNEDEYFSLSDLQRHTQGKQQI